MMTMSKTSMILITTIITLITLLFVYVDYTQGRMFNPILIVLCISNVFLIIIVVILQFEDTKTENWIYNKWYQLEYEDQRGIRAWAFVLCLLAYFIVIYLVLNLI